VKGEGNSYKKKTTSHYEMKPCAYWSYSIQRLRKASVSSFVIRPEFWLVAELSPSITVATERFMMSMEITIMKEMK